MVSPLFLFSSLLFLRSTAPAVLRFARRSCAHGTSADVRYSTRRGSGTTAFHRRSGGTRGVKKVPLAAPLLRCCALLRRSRAPWYFCRCPLLPSPRERLKLRSTAGAVEREEVGQSTTIRPVRTDSSAARTIRRLLTASSRWSRRSRSSRMARRKNCCSRLHRS